jgi:hypothetical protein
MICLDRYNGNSVKIGKIVKKKNKKGGATHAQIINFFQLASENSFKEVGILRRMSKRIPLCDN